MQPNEMKHTTLWIHIEEVTDRIYNWRNWLEFREIRKMVNSCAMCLRHLSEHANNPCCVLFRVDNLMKLMLCMLQSLWENVARWVKIYLKAFQLCHGRFLHWASCDKMFDQITLVRQQLTFLSLFKYEVVYIVFQLKKKQYMEYAG